MMVFDADVWCVKWYSKVLCLYTVHIMEYSVYGAGLSVIWSAVKIKK